MATLDAALQLPPNLIHEAVPTAAALATQIDPFVIWNVKSTIMSIVHYENQMYGPINSFHTSIFPTRRRFMTIPQAIIRRAMDADEVADDLANVSFGSTGALHESRDLPGHEVDKMFPDFVTVRVTPQPGGVRDHYIVCIVEVKRDEMTEGQAISQMYDYMEQAAQHPSREERLQGYLVSGNMVKPFWLDELSKFPKVSSPSKVTFCKIRAVTASGRN